MEILFQFAYIQIHDFMPQNVVITKLITKNQNEDLYWDSKEILPNYNDKQELSFLFIVICWLSYNGKEYTNIKLYVLSQLPTIESLSWNFIPMASHIGLQKGYLSVWIDSFKCFKKEKNADSECFAKKRE